MSIAHSVVVIINIILKAFIYHYHFPHVFPFSFLMKMFIHTEILEEVQ